MRYFNFANGYKNFNFMKKISSIVALLLIVVGAHATDPSASMKPIMTKATQVLDLIEDDHDLEVVRMEFDILRNTKTTIRTLSKGWTYLILAFGDDRFKDIDVRVYRKEKGGWTLVEKDNDSSEVAAVTVVPSYTEEYKIEITAYQFESGYDVGHYGLVIAHE